MLLLNEFWLYSLMIGTLVHVLVDDTNDHTENFGRL